MSVVYVHIGLPKTGTTHLQDRLWRNRDLALQTSGLLYPGNVISDHFHAAVHLQPERYLDWADPAFAGTWPKLLGQIRAWPQTSLLSHELYSTATSEQIERLLADLSFADEVHVIATVRDLARQLPSVWQENVKNQRRASFDEFVDSVASTARGDAVAGVEEEPFWEFQDHVGILGRWARFVGPERVHIVTVPARGSTGDTLWDRFLRVMDVDAAPLNIPVPSLNSSLSASQAEFLRGLNQRLQPETIEWRRYERIIKGQLIGEILFEAPSGPPQGLSGAHREWAAGQAASMVAAVREAGYDVVGDLTDLQVLAESVAGDVPAPSDREVLDVALDTIAAMVLAAPLPKVGPRARTRAANVLRRVKRRAIAVRRSL
ncbi:sulfotransferase family protein [Gordonia sp. zg691]|uniref:Sulfotransferase family protein n=1 Tax=Gordonia jinghuaiqii TaxID=2758710 RepID=A0A7D7QMV6_9ACTN|nr:sulfotransferase family protein [Gordonia jinghuaiqii]MBD0859920.1 sulfotransferase family protein [Gordonia jinghuaiqii]MCR5977085.1 sulfotransferase family protein [Gordonia jinghuaiqii]QMT00306.1 sulfotransferase family protein [Gordonia jinghuaiqii]